MPIGHKSIDNAASEAVKAISAAAGEAVKAIASAANEARLVLNTNASEAAKALIARNSAEGSDHDVLIRLVGAVANLDKNLSEKFAALKLDIKEITGNLSSRIDTLERNKLDIKESYPILYKNEDEKVRIEHTKRLEKLEDKILDFPLIKKLVFGAAGVILLSFLSTIIYIGFHWK
jgi:di/tripeptidase